MQQLFNYSKKFPLVRLILIDKRRLTKRHCSVKLSRSCGNRLFLQSLSSCLFFPSLILISLEYHGAAGLTVTVRVESGACKSNILHSSELYNSTLQDMSTRSTINNAISIPEFQQALRSCCTRRRAAIETEQIEKKIGCTQNAGDNAKNIRSRSTRL